MPQGLDLIVPAQRYWLPGKSVPNQSSLPHSWQGTTAVMKNCTKNCTFLHSAYQHDAEEEKEPTSTSSFNCLPLLPIWKPLHFVLSGRSNKGFMEAQDILRASPYCGQTQQRSNWLKILWSCFPLLSAICLLNWLSFFSSEVYGSCWEAWGLWMWCLTHSLITSCKCKHHHQQ